MINITARLLCVSSLAVGIASAASTYKLNIYDTTKVGATELSAGEYRVEMRGDKAVFTRGKKTVEVPAAIEKTENKFSRTTCTSVNSTMKEIDLGGTSEKIVFTVVPPIPAGTK